MKCLTNYLIAMTSCITSNFVFFPPKILPHVRCLQVKHGRPCSMLSFSLFRAVFSKCVCCFPVYAAPPVLHEYLISVELNFLDATALNHLNTILNRTASPIGLNGSIQVSGINVTTGTAANPSDKPPKRSFRITIKD